HDLALRTLGRRARAAAMAAEIDGEPTVDHGLRAHRRGEGRAAADADGRGIREAGDGAAGPKSREAAETEADGGIARDLIAPFEHLAVRHRDFHRPLSVPWRTNSNFGAPSAWACGYYAGNRAGGQRDECNCCSRTAD